MFYAKNSTGTRYSKTQNEMAFMRWLWRIWRYFVQRPSWWPARRGRVSRFCLQSVCALRRPQSLWPGGGVWGNSAGPHWPGWRRRDWRCSARRWTFPCSVRPVDNNQSINRPKSLTRSINQSIDQDHSIKQSIDLLQTNQLINRWHIRSTTWRPINQSIDRYKEWFWFHIAKREYDQKNILPSQKRHSGSRCWFPRPSLVRRWHRMQCCPARHRTNSAWPSRQTGSAYWPSACCSCRWSSGRRRCPGSPCWSDGSIPKTNHRSFSCQKKRKSFNKNQSRNESAQKNAKNFFSSKLHDVGLVNGSDLLPAVLLRPLKRKMGDPHRFIPRDDFQTLHNARNTLRKNQKKIFLKNFFENFFEKFFLKIFFRIFFKFFYFNQIWLFFLGHFGQSLTKFRWMFSLSILYDPILWKPKKKLTIFSWFSCSLEVKSDKIEEFFILKWKIPT